MSIEQKLIQEAAHAFLVPEVFTHIRGIVTGLESTTLTGAQKRAMAIQTAREYGVDIADWLLKAAIELAVGWLQTTNPMLGVAAEVAIAAAETSAAQ